MGYSILNPFFSSQVFDRFFSAALPIQPLTFTTPTLATAPTSTGKGRYYTPGLSGSPDVSNNLQACPTS